jgi:O-antigen/teichoic acid export membrane protein
MAIGPVLLMLLYGKEYSGALMILRILVVEVVLTGATQVLSQAFMALGRPGVITTLQVIGLSLTVPLMLLLIPRYGITGAALALLLSTCARFTFVLLSFPVYLHLPVPNLLIRWNDIRSIAHHVSRTLPGFAGMALSEK